jgi:hypothetical protein
MITHTAILFVVFYLAMRPSPNPDSGPAYIFSVIFLYLIDFPAGLIVTLLEPPGWLSLCIWVVLGSAQWFLIGCLVDWGIRMVSDSFKPDSR